MFSVVYGDATEEEIKALGYDPNDPWADVAPWEFAGQLAEYRERRAKAQEEALWATAEESQPAKECPLSPEELAEVDEEIYAEADQTEEETEVIGRNGLVLIDDPDWVDMTARPYDYIAFVNRQKKDVLTPKEKNYLTGIALHCGPNSMGCTAKAETLAEECGDNGDRNWHKAISKLTAAGWIRENGSMPPTKGNPEGTKIRHIGVMKAWLD